MKFERILPPDSKRRQILKKIFRKYIIKMNSEEKAYKSWIKLNEPTDKELKIQEKTKFDINPKISIVVPIYNTPEIFFKELIECLFDQTYKNWELCLADGSPEPLSFAKKYFKNDPRIKYSTISENKGIAGNTNEAIKLATGDFIALLDHDDLLPKFSLFEVVKAINENPEVEFIYSDEDKFEKKDGERYGAFFKPDFSIYTLRSANYICHFTVLKREIVEKIGGFRSEYDGSQDFDIVLRASELTNNIVHIPKILYHWRVHKNSTAGGNNEKPYAYEVAKKVIKDHLKRQNVNVKVMDSKVLGSYELKYIPNNFPLISIILDAKDLNSNEVNNILEKINKLTYKNKEILIISKNDLEILKDYNVRILKPNIKLQLTYNEVINNCKGEYFIVLDDKFISFNKEDCMEDLLGICQISDVGIVGTKIFDEQNVVKSAGIILNMNGLGDFVNKGSLKDAAVYASRLKIIHNVSATLIKYSLIKKDMFIKLNGFSKEFDGMLTSIDYCLRLLKENKEIVENPLVEVCVKSLEDIEFDGIQIKTFGDFWGEMLKKGDKYFNPNLRLDSVNICIKPFKVEE